jgi:hypothetical protein
METVHPGMNLEGLKDSLENPRPGYLAPASSDTQT